MKWSLAAVALAVLAVVALSRRLSGTRVTPQMAFLAIGVLAGPLAAGAVDPAAEGEAVRTLAEATLALVLFADASRIDLRALRGEHSLPVRLLGIGLPLTIALGAGLALLVFGGLTLAEALVLAVILAPTDAALGQAVVTDERVPMRVRQGLNVESGLNDGICVPLLYLAVAAADVESSITSGHSAVSLAAQEIGYGVLAGAGAGLITAAVLRIAGRRGMITPAWRQLAPVAGAGLAYGLATGLGGSGFIAAFVAGAFFGWLMHGETARIGLFGEEAADLLSGVTFLIFGAVLLYAVLSLTAARMLPVMAAMLGTGARAGTAAFIGWFGPRGLASIVFALIAVQQSSLPHEATIVLTAYVTVALSTLAHGASATGLSRRYSAWLSAHPEAGLSETELAPSGPIRARGPEAAAGHAGIG